MSKDTSTETNNTLNANGRSIEKSLEYPPVWRRFASMVYDSLILLAVSMGYGGIAMGIDQLVIGENDAFVSGALFQVGWLVVIIGFFCYFWIRAGQTIGMRTWRLQVVDSQTQQYPTLSQCVIRCLLAPIGLLLFVSAYARKDRQCLHDQLSKTSLILLPKPKK